MTSEVQHVDVHASRSQEATRLHLLAEKYDALQKRGVDENTLACLHEACQAKQELYGARHLWAVESVQDYATCVNIVAAKLLRTGEIESAQRLLLRAREMSAQDHRAGTATLLNLAVCMYSKEMPEDAIKFLSAAEASTNHFRAEKHLNLCAAHFKRKGLERALFHAQSAVRFAQIALTELASQNLPACFSKEAIVLLALAYHSLGIALVAQGYRRSWTSSGKLERERSVTQLLEGVKWHIKAYEEVALAHKWAVPGNLTVGLWLAFVTACRRCFPVLEKALDMDFMTERSDLRLVARIVLQQTRASQIQRAMRASLLRRETSAVLRIQQSTRTFLQSKRQLQVAGSSAGEATEPAVNETNETHDDETIREPTQSTPRSPQPTPGFSQSLSRNGNNAQSPSESKDKTQSSFERNAVPQMSPDRAGEPESPEKKTRRRKRRRKKKKNVNKNNEIMNKKRIETVPHASHVPFLASDAENITSENDVRSTRSDTTRKSSQIIHATSSVVHGAIRGWFKPSSASFQHRRKKASNKIMIE